MFLDVQPAVFRNIMNCDQKIEVNVVLKIDCHIQIFIGTDV